MVTCSRSSDLRRPSLASPSELNRPVKPASHHESSSGSPSSRRATSSCASSRSGRDLCSPLPRSGCCLLCSPSLRVSELLHTTLSSQTRRSSYGRSACSSRLDGSSLWATHCSLSLSRRQARSFRCLRSTTSSSSSGCPAGRSSGRSLQSAELTMESLASSGSSSQCVPIIAQPDRAGDSIAIEHPRARLGRRSCHIILTTSHRLDDQPPACRPDGPGWLRD